MYEPRSRISGAHEAIRSHRVKIKYFEQHSGGGGVVLVWSVGDYGRRTKLHYYLWKNNSTSSRGVAHTSVGLGT